MLTLFVYFFFYFNILNKEVQGIIYPIIDVQIFEAAKNAWQESYSIYTHIYIVDIELYERSSIYLRYIDL